MAIGISVISLVLSLGALAMNFVLLLRVTDLADKVERQDTNNPYENGHDNSNC